MVGTHSRINGLSILAGCLLAALSLLPPVVQAYQPQVPRSSSGDDAQILRQAQGAFNANNLLQAKQLVERIQDAPGSIGEQARSLRKTIEDIENNNTKQTNARIAIRRGKFAEACDLLREIQAAIDANKALKERYPDLNAMKEQAGGCQPAPATPPPPPPPAPDLLKPDYDKAIGLKDAGRLQEALTIFNSIRKSHPGYKDVDDMIGEIKQLLNKSEDERFAELSKKAAQLLSGGDLLAARRQLNVAEANRPHDPRLKELHQQLDAASKAEENELADAISAFYGGQYEQAQNALDNFLRGRHSPPTIAFARFYKGAALGSQYFLSGGKDQAMKNAAMELFQQTLKDYPAYSPRWDALSSRIKDLYSEATQKRLQ